MVNFDCDGSIAADYFLELIVPTPRYFDSLVKVAMQIRSKMANRTLPFGVASAPSQHHHLSAGANILVESKDDTDVPHK